MSCRVVSAERDQTFEQRVAELLAKSKEEAKVKEKEWLAAIAKAPPLNPGGRKPAKPKSVRYAMDARCTVPFTLVLC